MQIYIKKIELQEKSCSLNEKNISFDGLHKSLLRVSISILQFKKFFLFSLFFKCLLDSIRDKLDLCCMHIVQHNWWSIGTNDKIFLSPFHFLANSRRIDEWKWKKKKGVLEDTQREKDRKKGMWPTKRRNRRKGSKHSKAVISTHENCILNQAEIEFAFIKIDAATDYNPNEIEIVKFPMVFSSSSSHHHCCSTPNSLSFVCFFLSSSLGCLGFSLSCLVIQTNSRQFRHRS